MYDLRGDEINVGDYVLVTDQSYLCVGKVLKYSDAGNLVIGTRCGFGVTGRRVVKDVYSETKVIITQDPNHIEFYEYFLNEG
jgi:hypothetical protein